MISRRCVPLVQLPLEAVLLIRGINGSGNLHARLGRMEREELSFNPLDFDDENETPLIPL